jgi:hypothetical protein
VEYAFTSEKLKFISVVKKSSGSKERNLPQGKGAFPREEKKVKMEERKFSSENRNLAVRGYNPKVDDFKSKKNEKSLGN